MTDLDLKSSATIRILGRPKDPEKAKIYDEASRGIDRIEQAAHETAARFTGPVERVIDLAMLVPLDLVLDRHYNVYLSVVRDAAAELTRLPRMAIVDPLGKLVREKVRGELAPQREALNAIREQVAESTPITLRDWTHQPMYSTVVVVDPFTRMTIGLETIDRVKGALAIATWGWSEAAHAVISNTLSGLRETVEREGKEDSAAEDAMEDA